MREAAAAEGAGAGAQPPSGQHQPARRRPVVASVAAEPEDGVDRPCSTTRRGDAPRSATASAGRSRTGTGNAPTGRRGRGGGGGPRRG